MTPPKMPPRAAPVNPSLVNSCACEPQTAPRVNRPTIIVFIGSYRFDGASEFLFVYDRYDCVHHHNLARDSSPAISVPTVSKNQSRLGCEVTVRYELNVMCCAGRLAFLVLAVCCAARAEQVVISKIMYHPPGDLPEYLELFNNTATP